jgi:Putative peptidoglycan binding domain
VAAEYKTVTRQVVDTPASTRDIAVPAQFKTITRQVIDTPASTREVDVPAQYRTVKVAKVVEEAKLQINDTPAQYDTVSKTVKVSDASYQWRSILCETNATTSKIAEIQTALKTAGYNPGPIDGVPRRETMQAINAYQSAKGLPVDPYINMETVKSLGVAAK